MLVSIWQQNVYHQFSTSTHSMMLKKNPSWVLCYYNTRVPVNSLVKSYKWNKYYVCLTSSHLLCESQSHPTASWPHTMAKISKFCPKMFRSFSFQKSQNMIRFSSNGKSRRRTAFICKVCRTKNIKNHIKNHKEPSFGGDCHSLQLL